MIIAAAQTSSKSEDIQGNLEDHYKFIDMAVYEGAQLIVFPEMSITGYQRQSASKYSFEKDDSRLDKLRDLSVKNNIIIITGAPIKIDLVLYIGSFIILPNGEILIYIKQFLHPGEEGFFKPSFDYNPIIELENERISLAICADIDNALHSENAYKKQTTIYIPSIFFSPAGINDAYDILSKYAEKYSMNVLMSNFCGKSWGTDAAGKSAFWNQKGKLISSLDNKNPGLLIMKKEEDNWVGQVI